MILIVIATSRDCIFLPAENVKIPVNDLFSSNNQNFCVMYFLAKNIRICSKSFRGTPLNIQLFKNGVLDWDYLAKNLSYFLAHPEQIKQQLKEKDAQMLFQFFDSDEYKKRLSEFLEKQDKILLDDAVTGNKDSCRVKYQHVLSCAQPPHKNKKTSKTFIDIYQESNKNRRKKIRKGTIFEVIKERIPHHLNGESHSASFGGDRKPRRKEKSTIMPIFLEKIKSRQKSDECEYEEKETQDVSNYLTARRVKKITEKSEPLYVKILHKSNAYRINTPQGTSDPLIHTKAMSKENENFEIGSRVDSRYLRNPLKSNQTVDTDASILKDLNHQIEATNINNDFSENNNFKFMNNSIITKEDFSHEHSTSFKRPNYKLKKSSFMQNKPSLAPGSSSRMAPLRMASSATKNASKGLTTKLCPRKNMNLKSYSEFLNAELVRPIKVKKDKMMYNTPKIDALNHGHEKNKIKTIPLLMKRLKQDLSSDKFQNQLEKKSTMMQILKNKIGKKAKQQKDELESMSLFKKVKLGNPRNTKIDTMNVTEPKQPSIQVTPPKFDNTGQESFTFKIVSKNRQRRDAKLKQLFKLNLPYREDKFQLSMEPNKDPVDFQKTMELGTISKNIPANLHKPFPHFVEHVNKPKLLNVNKYHGKQYILDEL